MLINCAVYADGNKLEDIGIDEVAAHLGSTDRFVWVALLDPTDQELEQAQALFGLHELAIEDVRHGQQRPKVEEYGAVLYTVMHTLGLHQGQPGIGEVHVFAGPDFVLSVRLHSNQALLGVRERCEREPELLRLGPAFVLYALMDAVVDRYFPVIDGLESELEAIEDQIFVKAAARNNVERLYELKRKFGCVRHAVSPLLDAVGKLYSGRVPPLVAHTEPYFRDIADHLQRIHGSLDASREAINTAIQVNLSMVTIEDGEVTKRLAAWAGIFAAATALVGVWGMNFEVMPELKWRYGYPMALLAIVGTCSFLYWRFKRIGWL